ncbi:MAG: hypothetical protein Q4C18_03640 [Eubacteriales bacterium]|nr:hypothetical protein [Eubacteriales bacterium]
MAYEDEYDEEDEEAEEATYTPYDEAINCIDQEGPYGGRVVSWSSPDVNGNPLFINIGADYPDDSRLTVVIWGENREEFIDNLGDALLDEDVVVWGTPYEYNGAAQIEVTDPSELMTYEEYQESVG